MKLRLMVILATLGSGLVYAQSPGAFTATGSMATARYSHTATPLYDGKVLIAGGYGSPTGDLGNSSVESSAEIHDPASGTFTTTGTMLTLRAFFSATLLPNGKVLITGGAFGPPHDGGFRDPLSITELFDPATGKFTAGGNMTTPRYGSSAILLRNGKVLIAGGVSNTALNTALATAELYDPSTETFSPTGDMVAPQFRPLMALLPNGNVLLIDGGGSDYSYSPTAQIYDSEAGTFSVAASVDILTSGTATVLPSGKVLLAGINGYWASWVISNREDLYDPARGSFTATGSLTNVYSAPTATLLPDGKVLIAGGWCSVCRTPTGGYNMDARADIYDPTRGTFSATGSMATGRMWATATLLNSGQVLISGGDEFWAAGAGVRDVSDHPILSSAELYTPESVVPAPALLSASGDGQGQGAILHANTPLLASSGSNPASADEALEIYCTGLPEGSVIPPQMTIGGRVAEILYFGEAPGWPGLNQINVRVPTGSAPGFNVPVRMNYFGRFSNEVTIALR